MSNVLIVGSGGREHSLQWKLRQSSSVGEVFVTPGNGGIRNSVDVNINDVDEISKFCDEQNIKIVLIGPEEPLSRGIVDNIKETNKDLLTFGPNKNGAQLETSKVFAKNFMTKYNLPTADYQVIKSMEELNAFFAENDQMTEIVVKADGLAAGKGVVIPKTREEAKNVAASMLQGSFGACGKQLLLEEKLNGYEVSALAFVDGKSFKRMPLVRDYKKLLDGDSGPNTGGMGVMAPVKIDKEVDSAIEKIFHQTLIGLEKENIEYCGVLYIGFMVVNNKPFILEYNCRFGDPETQILMRLLDSDLYSILYNCTNKTLEKCDIKWNLNMAAIGIVLASKNYPKSGSIGDEITNMPQNDETVVVFHSGTRCKKEKLETNGGRIMCISILSSNFEKCRDLSLKYAEQITFNGKQYRADIGIISKNSSSLTYETSGVSIEEGNQFVEDIKSMIKSTLRPGTSQIGGFGAVVDLKQLGFPNESQLIVGIDGVGTKIEIASQLSDFSTIGFDVVAMCVNDILCHCAEPIAFLDYFVCGRLRRQMAASVIKSISKACIESGCALIGGETAEMPGVYGSNQWDLAGCAIGCRDKSWPALPLSNSIKMGDILLGLPSNGLHSNGFSLARKIVEINNIKYNQHVPWSNDETFGSVLIKATKIYVKSVLPLLKEGLVKGCAHITGGGLVENVIRVLDKNSDLMFEIDCSTWKPGKIFHWLASSGPVESGEMLKTFNCGIGMVLICNRENVKEVQKRLQSIGEICYEIGKVLNKTDEKRLITFKNQEKLFDYTLYKSNRRKVRVAILISGTGSNMKKLIEKSKTAESNCEIVIVISNKNTAKGLEIAKEAGIATEVVPHTSDRVTGDLKMVEILRQLKVELICLAGFMRILSKEFVAAFPERIINIHPSLLPSFKGAHALKDALDCGVQYTGCTAHYVDEEVDHGKIIGQKPVEITSNDTIESLQEKIQKEEHLLFPNAMVKAANRILKEK